MENVQIQIFFSNSDESVDVYRLLEWGTIEKRVFRVEIVIQNRN